MAAAAPEVHRGLQGARHRRGQGRAGVGADGEVRRLRLQQVPGRRYLGRDGRRLAQADHRGARGRRRAHQGRPARGAARPAQRDAAGRPPGPGQRHGAAVHARSSDLHAARVGERAEARARTTRWPCSTRWRPRICAWRPAVARGRRAAAWCWRRCRSSGATPLSYTTEGTEPTYDIEVPGAANFIANGIAVHNSHAAAYGLVAYQTAYFKANYPVEFMAALLTSEMGDTDKIVKYIEECRAMGIRVRAARRQHARRCASAWPATRSASGWPPSRTSARRRWSRSSRRAPTTGAFTTLDDFCVRVDLRLVNRRVIESLIKAGAFDSLGLTRAHLLTPAATRRWKPASASSATAPRARPRSSICPAAAPAPRRRDAARRGAGVGRRSAPGATRRKCSASTSRATRWRASRASAEPLGRHLVGRAGLARPRRARHALRPRRRDQGDGDQERQSDGVPHARGHGTARSR